MTRYIDPLRDGVQPETQTRCLEIGAGPMGQVVPLGDLSRDVVRDSADGEVRVRVGNHHGDLASGCHLASAQRGAESRHTASDHDEVHGGPFRPRLALNDV